MLIRQSPVRAGFTKNWGIGCIAILLKARQCENSNYLMPDVWIYFAICASAFLAGAINAIAGGGTLLTFPALLALLSPVMANGTSTVALLPGSLASAWAYRQDVRHPPQLLWWLFLPSLLGGLIGTLLVTRTAEHYFATLVPWLILGAALLFSLQPMISKLVKSTSASELKPHTTNQLLGLAIAQLLVSIYGGYFGAGVGILMLSAFAYMGFSDVHQMNALKSILATLINGVAAILFLLSGKVDWHYALPMMLSAIAGGYMGARMSLRFKSSSVRRVVIVIGFGMGAYYLYEQYAG